MLSQIYDNIPQTTPDQHQMQWKFLRRLASKENLVFVFPDMDDICVHSVDDIVLKLPVPTSVGETMRSRNQFKFYSGKIRKVGAELQ